MSGIVINARRALSQRVFGASESDASGFRRTLKPLAVATLLGLASAAAVAADPAVNQTNLKFMGLGGEVSGESAWSGIASLTSPIGQEWGLQLEGGVGGAESDTLVGGAMHLFWRDPDSHLVGLFAAHTTENDLDIDVTKVGAEAEIYLQQITVLAKAGYQFSEDVSDTAFASIDVRWYATDNFTISAGSEITRHNTIGRLEIEYMPDITDMPGLALNLRGAIGDDDYDSVMAGVTYYFGTDATLKDRHRKQDPDSALFSLFQSVQTERDALVANPT